MLKYQQNVSLVVGHGLVFDNLKFLRMAFVDLYRCYLRNVAFGGL